MRRLSRTVSGRELEQGISGHRAGAGASGDSGAVVPIALRHGGYNGGAGDHCNKSKCNQKFMHGRLLE
jgi:hypothetical protein